MLLGVLALAVEQGYSASDQIKAQTQRLAAVMMRARERVATTRADATSSSDDNAATP